MLDLVTKFQSVAYKVPDGAVGNRFLEGLAARLAAVTAAPDGVETMATVLVYSATMLGRRAGVTKAPDVRLLLTQRLDRWDNGEHEKLAVEHARAAEAWHKTHAGAGLTTTEETRARKYVERMLFGKIREAVRGATDRGGSGVHNPDDPMPTAANPARTAADVLREKTPPAVEPLEEAFMPPPPEGLPPLPRRLYTAQDVTAAASHLRGAAGVTGMDAEQLRSLLLRKGEASGRLRSAVAELCTALSNDPAEWRKVRALLTQRSVALKKADGGVRPLGIREPLYRLLAKMVLRQCVGEAEEVCGADNVCAGQRAGVEAAAHCMRGLLAEGGDDDVVLLADAENAFNLLNRQAALWTIRLLWPSAAMFIFNCYRGPTDVVVWGAGATARFKCTEGTVQGDPLAMPFYAVGALPAVWQLRDYLKAEPPDPGAPPSRRGTVQVFYADDGAVAGSLRGVLSWFAQLEQRGPLFGIFPNADKSVIIVRGSEEKRAAVEAAVRAAGHAKMKVVRGQRYLGGWLGVEDLEREWVDAKVASWAAAVRVLASIAASPAGDPHCAYVGLYRSLQCEWQHLQRVSAVAGEPGRFQAVEDAIANEFLPAIFGADVTAWERRVCGLPTGHGGLGLADPNEARAMGDPYLTSVEATRWLAARMCDGAPYGHRAHTRAVSAASAAFADRKEAWAFRTWQELDAAPLADASPPPGLPATGPRSLTQLNAATRAARLRTGTFLNVPPRDDDNFHLSRAEFQDCLALRYGRELVDAPELCDGCGKPFSARHAASCPVGGLPMRRHNELVGCIAKLLMKAGFHVLEYEPRIRYRSDEEDAAAGLIGDIRVRGLFNDQRDTVIDVKMADLDCESYAKRLRTQKGDVEAVLSSLDQEKRKKHEQACRALRVDFAPATMGIDGSLSPAFQSLLRRVVTRLARKTGAKPTVVAGSIKATVQMAIARAASMCLRSARQRIRGPRGGMGERVPPVDSAAGLAACEAPHELDAAFD
jgi:hypothetical protein